jgi:hypothetical protein
MNNEVANNEVANNKVANNELVEQYIAQFTPSEKIVYEIARKQLESSFCIEKSIGFLEYVKNLSSKENQ